MGMFGTMRSLRLMVAVFLLGLTGSACGGGGSGTGVSAPVAHLRGAITIATGTLRPPEVDGRLMQVSCPRSSYCVGFGDYGDRSGGGHPLIAMLENGSWAAVNAPTKGLVPPPARDDPSFVPGGISCPVAGWCVAMGSYEDSAHNVHGLIEMLSQGRWTAITAPLAGLRLAPAPNADVVFHTVRCQPAGRQCLALGSYEDRAHDVADFMERFNGTSWSPSLPDAADLVPPPRSRGVVSLDDVSCPPRPAADACVVVGRYRAISGTSLLFADTVSGAHQSARALPTGGLEPVAAPDARPALYSVACPSPAHCVAVGTYRDVSGNTDGLAETYSGGAWSARSLPKAGLRPPVRAGEQLSPGKVDCPSATYCTAVGTYRAMSGAVLGFAETFLSGKWSATTLPDTPARPVRTDTSLLALDDLACPAPARCIAVGYYSDAHNRAHGLIEKLANGSWAAADAPIAGLTPPEGGKPGVHLYGLTCLPGGSCMSVGSYSDSSDDEHPLAERTAV